MGKIYRLSEKSDLIEATIKLIEKSFHYDSKNSFAIDFAPLVDKSNLENCYILVDDEGNVIAHVGARERHIKFQDKKIPVTMLGGITVDETKRGEGHFHTLFQKVLSEKRDECAFFLLWSDLEKLYAKYGFHLCGSQIQVQHQRKSSNFDKTKYANLSEVEKHQIQKLYCNSFSQNYVTIGRSEHDWSLIEKISSADLFIEKKDGVIKGYFFMSKGQDLPEIIYEYGTEDNFDDFVKRIAHFGVLWTGREIIPSSNIQFQFLLAPADPKKFGEFISLLTAGAIEIVSLNSIKQEVYFNFNDDTFSLPTDEFLRGVFGPSSFEEIVLPTIFISGLESI